ncbi:MAG: hypothetical protein AAFU65_06055 [Pseudomonadota bacterium]
MSSLTTAIAAVAGLGACAILATALNPSEVTPAATDTSPTATQGAVVVRDAETGTLRAATAREAARYAVQGSSKAETVALRRADGSLSARLDDSHMIYTTVTRNADGEWVESCGMDHDHSTHQAPTVEREVR